MSRVASTGEHSTCNVSRKDPHTHNNGKAYNHNQSQHLSPNITLKDAERVLGHGPLAVRNVHCECHDCRCPTNRQGAAISESCP